MQESESFYDCGQNASSDFEQAIQSVARQKKAVLGVQQGHGISVKTNWYRFLLPAIISSGHADLHSTYQALRIIVRLRNHASMVPRTSEAPTTFSPNTASTALLISPIACMPPERLPKLSSAARTMDFFLSSRISASRYVSSIKPTARVADLRRFIDIRSWIDRLKIEHERKMCVRVIKMFPKQRISI